MIEVRQKTIADGLAAAEQGRRSLETSTRQADDEIKASARPRRRDPRAGRKARGADDRGGQQRRARKRATARRPPPRRRSSRKLTRAREQLRDQVASLAVAGAEKILRREVDAKAHAELLDSIKRQL